MDPSLAAFGWKLSLSAFEMFLRVSTAQIGVRAGFRHREARIEPLRREIGIQRPEFEPEEPDPGPQMTEVDAEFRPPPKLRKGSGRIRGKPNVCGGRLASNQNEN